MEEELIFLRVSELNIDVFGEGLSELHFAVRGQRRDPAFWRWRYFHNPLGKSILIVALRGSRVVGMYAMLYLSLTVQGSTVVGGAMGDLSIHLSERSWRCYNGLVAMCTNESLKDKPALYFGIAPSNLAKLHQQLGVITLGRVPVYLGFLNFVRILEGRSVPYPLSLAGWLAYPIMGLKDRSLKGIDLEIRSVENFDSAVDELWSSGIKNSTVAVVRNAAYLNWRYGKYFGCRFERLAAYREKKLEGLVIFCVTGPRNSSLVLELLARDDHPEIIRALLLRALAELRTKRTAHVIASFPADSQAVAVLRELGFKPWPGRFFSVPVIIVARPPKELYPKLDLKNWDFSLGDWLAP